MKTFLFKKINPGTHQGFSLYIEGRDSCLRSKRSSRRSLISARRSRTSSLRSLISSRLSSISSIRSLHHRYIFCQLCSLFCHDSLLSCLLHLLFCREYFLFDQLCFQYGRISCFAGRRSGLMQLMNASIQNQ